MPDTPQNTAFLPQPEEIISRLNAADSRLSALNRHRLTGLLYYYADDRPQAAQHFNKAAALDDEEMLSLHYLTHCQRGTLVQTAKAQRQLLNRAIAYTKAGGMEDEALYYIGHIFLFNGMTEGAVRCFGRCGNYLPALYMEVVVMHHIDPTLDLSPHIQFLLKEETRQTGQGPDGFLHAPTPLSDTRQNFIKTIQHHAFSQEIVSGVALVKEWRQGRQPPFDKPLQTVSTPLKKSRFSRC